MKNYKFYFEPGEQQDILNILRGTSNDILIDGVTEDTISFTIELEDEAADQLYEDLKNEVKTKIFATRGHVI